ncbi:aminotransferase class I/II-fold pyridoxal phosphate-dependent enzyme [bacterium]|nr:aminotransferase class I/II-fold pyridoxal phosphate-dependent enzyme [bacterium]
MLSRLGLDAGRPAISDLMRLALARPDLISLAAGFVDQYSLPVHGADEAWRDIMDDAASARSALQYGTTQGDPVLRYALAQRLLAELPETAAIDPATIAERIIVTTGSQQLLYLLAEALVDPGDIVIAEAPTYFVFLDLLAARGARVIGVPIDEGGMCLAHLEALLERLTAEGEIDRVKMIYSVSEHSNPSGLSLAADRRGPLVELARKFGRNHPIYVLDDAAYRGLTFEGPEAPSLWSHDASGDLVIHARTFSKTLSPGVKIGYGVVPQELFPTVLALKGHHDFGSSNLMQRLILKMIESGQYDAQIERVKGVYASKASVVVETLEATLGDLKPAVHWTVPRGGLYVWFSLPEHVRTSRDGEFFAACLEEGVFYVPGEYCFPAAVESGQRDRNRMRLCYGVPPEPILKEGVERLARVVRRTLGA